MSNAYENYIKSISRNAPERLPSKYKEKLNYLKQLIREYVHENAALVDELEEMQAKIIIREEERKFLLRKLCEYEPQVAAEVQNLAKVGFNQLSSTPPDKKGKKRSNESNSDRKVKKRRTASKPRKKIVQPIALDTTGRPIFPIDLGSLTVHCLGEVIGDRSEFHSEEAIYPVGYLATRIYGSLDDPTVKCMYSCKISEVNGAPRFVIESDDSNTPIVGDTTDACHSLLLQRINDALSLNVVSTRPRGNEFFGLNHPTVLNLVQSLPGSRKCTNYKWNKFEVSRTGNGLNTDDNDAGLNFEYLQRSINFCKYKMAPDVLQKPNDDFLDKDNLHEYLLN